jgi:Zn-dependent M28 family amino/carboxypeptidase
MGLSALARGQAGGLMGVLQTKGIAAILSVQSNYPRNASGRKGNQSINLFRRSLQPQQFAISETVARAIAGSAFDVVKEDKASIRVFEANVMLDVNKTTLSAVSTNVVGVLPGTDKKDEYLVITAHYDHLGKRDTVIYYGADDDGSGTVAVIEMAEAFAKAKAAGRGPRRTIVFMTVSGEEKGLWGSEVYSDRPLFPLEKTTANLNIDMIGRSDVKRPNDTLNYVYVVGDDKLSSDLRPISEEANKKIKLELDYKYNDPKDPNRIYFRSDHYNFARKGVPIIFYYDGMLGADYHRPTDTPEKINYPLAARRAQLVFYTAWEMANRNEMLKRDIPLDPTAVR